MTKPVKLSKEEQKIAKNLGIDYKKATIEDKQKIKSIMDDIKNTQIEEELTEIRTYLVIDIRLVKIIAIILLFLIMACFLYLMNINTFNNQFDF